MYTEAMKRPLLLLAAALLLIGAGCAKRPPAASVPDALKAVTFTIDGKTQPLQAGRLDIFGVPTQGDLDGDGDPDEAMILVAQPGGSGTFYYAAVAMNDNGTYKGSNAILLGDRVAPQNVAVSNGMIIANYAERKPGEPFTTPPSVGVSKYIRVENGKLTEMPKP